MSLFAFRSLAIWPSTERIGHQAGISGAKFGNLTSLSNLLGFVARLVGGSSGTRFDRTVPGAALLLASGIAYALQAAPSSGETFAITLVAAYVLWFLAYPPLIGAACALDPVGRLPTLCTAVWLLSQATGTTVAGRFGMFLFVSIPPDRVQRIAAGQVGIAAARNRRRPEDEPCISPPEEGRCRRGADDRMQRDPPARTDGRRTHCPASLTT